MYKRRLQRIKAKSFESSFEFTKAVKITKWKPQLIKLVLIFFLLCIFVVFLYRPTDHRRTGTSSIFSQMLDAKRCSRGSRLKILSSNLLNFTRLTWGSSYHPYTSDADIDWEEISRVLNHFSEDNIIKHVGILNFNLKETHQWQHLIPNANHTVLNLDYADKTTTWEALYPEWIDEEQQEEIPRCPSLPTVKLPDQRLDLIALKLPCRETNWSRDVGRLHLQIAVASLAASHKGTHPLHLLFVTSCFPTPTLFNCKDLAARERNTWLYKPNLSLLREKLRLPLGSCELALPLGGIEEHYPRRKQREAYATILHSNYIYVCGAIVVAQSIKMSGSTRDLVILVDKYISDYHRTGLEMAGWQVRTIDRIRNPRAEKDAYNEWNYSKFRLWQLTDYDKLIFIDSDLLVLKNIDFLFAMPELSATGNHDQLFNSGVMVIEPSNCTFNLLLDHVNDVESYNGGDQGYLNEMFTWWHRVPKRVNFLKHFWAGDDEAVRRQKAEMFGAEPPVLYVLHYLGNKPWMCFRDYDCNWNVDVLREFASDAAHGRWWKVHDAMPEKLHDFCLLRALQKAQLEWDRREAERGNFSDGHWLIGIKDERILKCIDQDCDWEERLRHWGEKTAAAARLAATLSVSSAT